MNANDRYEELKAEAQARLAAQAAAAPVKKKHHNKFITVIAVAIILVVGIVFAASHGSHSSSASGGGGASCSIVSSSDGVTVVASGADAASTCAVAESGEITWSQMTSGTWSAGGSASNEVCAVKFQGSVETFYDPNNSGVLPQTASSRPTTVSRSPIPEQGALSS